MNKKNIVIGLILLLLFTVTNIKTVSAVETDLPVIEEISFTDGGATEIDTLEMAAPINIEPNELLLIVICSDNPQTGTYFNEINGWTKLGESGNSVCDSHIAVYFQIANGSQINTNVTGTTTSNMLGWILRISGVDQSDAIEDSNFAASTAAGTNPQVVPSITTLKDNTLVLYGLSFDGGDGYPMNVVSPYYELADRTNTGTPTEAYVSGTIGYRELLVKGDSGDATVYTANVDGASYFQLAINGDVASVATTGTGFFYDLFLSDNIWSLLGPITLVILCYFMAKEKQGLGFVGIILQFLFIANYAQLMTAGEPAYIWHILILLLGGLPTCLIPTLTKR